MDLDDDHDVTDVNDGSSLISTAVEEHRSKPDSRKAIPRWFFFVLAVTTYIVLRILNVH